MTKFFEKFKVLNLFILAFAIAICFAFVGCDTPSTNGNTSGDTGGTSGDNGGQNQQTQSAVGSYAHTKALFQTLTGASLPDIENIEFGYAIGNTYLMFDITGGANCTQTTYESIKTYMNATLTTGWTHEDTTGGNILYPTETYTHTTTNTVIRVTWNGESAGGGIYLNADFTANTYDIYSLGKDYFNQKFNFNFPSLTGVTADFSFNHEATQITFDITKTANFAQTDFDAFVSGITAKLGAATDQSSVDEQRKSWTWSGLNYSVCWDLTTGISVDISDT